MIETINQAPGLYRDSIANLTATASDFLEASHDDPVLVGGSPKRINKYSDIERSPVVHRLVISLEGQDILVDTTDVRDDSDRLGYIATEKATEPFSSNARRRSLALNPVSRVVGNGIIGVDEKGRILASHRVLLPTPRKYSPGDLVTPFFMNSDISRSSETTGGLNIFDWLSGILDNARLSS